MSVLCYRPQSINASLHRFPAFPYGRGDGVSSLIIQGGRLIDIYSTHSHLSQASVVDLSKKLNEVIFGVIHPLVYSPLTAFLQSANQDNDTIGNLRKLLQSLPIGGGDDDKMGAADNLQEKSKAYSFNPDDVAPPEVQQQLWELLKWRDDVYRDIIKKIELVPGLTDLIENLTNALNACTYLVFINKIMGKSHFHISM